MSDAGCVRPAVVADLPAILYVEVTNRCNSLCRTCIRTFQTLEPPKDLTLAELVTIADRFPRLERVYLHGIGEPLLNPHLFQVIAYLKDRGAVVTFNSDTIGLTDKKRDALIESRLDELRVSLDAATAESYRAIRGVQAFDKVVGNVAAFVELRRRRGSATPSVSLWFTILRSNLQELPGFIRLAGRIGVDAVNLQRLVHFGKGLAVAEQSLHGTVSTAETELLAEAAAVAREQGIRVHASGNTTPEASLTPEERRRPWAGCQRPWTLSYITANGNVLPCCISPWTSRDYRGLILGNALNQPFEAVWNGQAYQEFRTRFESDMPPEPCHGCGSLWSI